MTQAVLERTTFETSRLLEYFSDKELQMQIGFPRPAWPIALVKELIDNALDACETAGVPPKITITVDRDAVSVEDNGAGVPASVIERSLDYSVRVSDKSHYVSPTRGQLGNALKCLWAAPCVWTGNQGHVEIHTSEGRHDIRVTLDRIAGMPQIDYTIRPDSDVKSGTKITMHWPEIAGYLTDTETFNFYTIHDLIYSYSDFNPHASWALRATEEGEGWDYESDIPEWVKWSPNRPTSPHWYSPQRFVDLLAAYAKADRMNGSTHSVRDVIAEFSGLRGSQKQKQVTDCADLTGATLEDLVTRDGINKGAALALLRAMQQASKVIPARPWVFLAKSISRTQWLPTGISKHRASGIRKSRD